MRKLIIILFLILLAIPAQADIVLWNSTKNMTKQGVTLEAAQEFTTCSISPDGGSGWDNCTAYIIIKNNATVDITLANLDFIHNWNKPAFVKGFSADFTKNFVYFNQNRTIRKGRPDEFNITQQYINATNFVNYSIAKSGTLFRGQSAVARINFQKKTWQPVHFNFTGKYGALEVLLDPDVSACGTLDQDGATYSLLNNIYTDSDVCLDITANNIIFNGNNYNINSSYWFGIYIEGINNSLYNFTVNESLGDHGVEIEGYNTTLFNFSVNGSLYDGIDIASDGNTIYNFSSNYNGVRGVSAGYEDSYIYNFTSKYNDGFGIGLDYNNIVENAEISNNYGFYKDYVIWGELDNHQLININLTGVIRGFYLVGILYPINITNNNINWKTNISIGDNSFNRQVFNWTQDNLTWNDNNATGGISAYYNLSGLYPSRNYSIYNNSVLDHNATTDSSGTLPQFSLSLAPTTEIKVLAEKEEERSCDWCKGVNVKIYANGSSKSYGTGGNNEEGNVSMSFIQYGTDDWYEYNLTVDTQTTKELNESSNNGSLGMQVTLQNVTANANHTIKIFYENGTKYQDFFIISNSSGFIKYNTTGFEEARYTIIVKEEPSVPYVVIAIAATVIIGGTAIILRRFKKV